MDRQTKMLDLIKNQSLTYKKLYEQALGGEMPKVIANFLLWDTFFLKRARIVASSIFV